MLEGRKVSDIGKKIMDGVTFHFRERNYKTLINMYSEDLASVGKTK
jgi:hypothetical protein